MAGFYSAGDTGSAALIVLTAAALQSPFWGLVYIVIFGIGSIVGMATLSALIAWPISYTSQSAAWLNHGLQLVIGGATVALGVVVMLES